MDLSYGVSLLRALLWGCICFPPQKGYNIAHGYSLDNEFSRHAGVLGPQPSNQFHATASLNPNQDSVSRKDDRQAMRHQSFVPLQRGPVDHENNKRAGFVRLSDEMKKSKPESDRDVPSSPPEREHSGQHPFGLLVKEHTKGKPKPSTSFSTIRDLKLFIESMKRSFLMPGNVMGRHFQTAREIIENEMASNTQNVNTMGQHGEGYRSYPAKEDTARGNEDWSEALEQGANYQMPSKSLSVPDPVDSEASLISTSVYDNQGDSPGYALYPRHHLAATEDVSSNYGGFDRGGILGGNPDCFTRAPDERNKAVQSTSYKPPKQIPSGSFFGNDLSFSGHVTASPVNHPNSPSHNFSNYSSKTRTTEKNIQQQPKYTFNSKASLTGDRKRSGLKLGKDVKSQELNRVAPDDILTTPMPPSFNSYGHVVYVSAPRGQRYIPDYQPEHRKSAARSSRAYQPIVGQQSNSINLMPTAHMPVSTGYVSLLPNNPSPQSSSVLVRVQTSNPHNAQNLAFIRKKPVRFYTTHTAQPSSSLHGSSRHDGYLQDQTVSVSRPFTLTAQPIDEKSDLSKQNRVSASRGSTQKAENTQIPVSSGLDSIKSGISSLFRVGDANTNSITNLAPTSAAERPFSRLVANDVRSRNYGINNEISDIRGARNSLGSSSSPLRRGISLNRNYASATRPGLHIFRKPTKLWKRRAIMNKKPGNVVYRRPKLAAMSPPSVNLYVVQSRNRYVRSKVYRSKTCYTPYKNTGSLNVTGLEQSKNPN